MKLMGQMPTVGDVIGGEYKLLSVAGVGGMATIFEASHIETGLQVAIKFLRPEHSDDDAVTRFHLEAEAASAEGHESNVSIYATGTTDQGVHYLVMELLNGRSLGERIKRDGQLDTSLTAYIGCQVLSGLAAVHQTGVIHRDLKVDNIYLIRSGGHIPQIKLLDFGLSRITKAETFGKEDAQLTRKGFAVGTPAYMSPEQASGRRDLDSRTDIYSVGIILYRCLTGASPFDSETAQDILLKVMTEAPTPIQQLRPDVPPGLVRIVERALFKDRSDRYQSAEIMFDELLEFVDHESKRFITYPRNHAERTAFVTAISPEEVEQYRTRSSGPGERSDSRSSMEGRKRSSKLGMIVFAAIGLFVFFSAITAFILLNPFG